MILNGDIGERGPEHPIDVALMAHLGLANLACGGHAGDAESVAAFRELADHHRVALAAHLSYPDREQFGRISLDLPWPDLRSSLEDQWSLVPDLRQVKFHGALYHDSATSRELASRLVPWLLERGVTTVICPRPSVFASCAAEAGIAVLAEAFLERRYQVTPDGGVGLVPRSSPDAVLEHLDEAVAQAQGLIRSSSVVCTDGVRRPVQADTVCLHSDSPIALELAREVASLLEPGP